MMKASRLLPLTALALTAATCEDPEARQQIAALRGQVDTLTMWLGKSDPKKDSMPPKTVHQWHLSVDQALCALEDKVFGTGPGRTYCPRDISHEPPPPPPPWF